MTIDAAALCLKSGNAVVLRGSSSATALKRGAGGRRLPRRGRARACPRHAISLIGGGDRDELAQLATQSGVVDLIIPRGGEGLKAALNGVATVPVIYAASGNNHVFVDATADLEMALEIVLNAKLQRPGVCNAAEKLLVHADAAAALPAAARWRALHAAGVQLHGDDACPGAGGRRAGRRRHRRATGTPSIWRSSSRSRSSTRRDEAIEHINRARLAGTRRRS